jgi:phosphopantetheinyl transferase (holo-ACP synthase)
MHTAKHTVRSTSAALIKSWIEFGTSRWAAKEAAFKAFGRGRGEVLFTEMRVANEPSGTTSR